MQVVYDPLGLLDQISSPEAANLILDLFERAPNRAMYLHAVWLATQMMVRNNFDERQRARLGVLVLARWRADPEKAPRDLAQLIAVLPAGFREAFSRAAAQGGNTDFGYVLEHGEDVSAAAAERMASRIVDRGRTGGTPAGSRRTGPSSSRWCARACSTGSPSAGTWPRSCSPPRRTPTTSARRPSTCSASGTPSRWRAAGWRRCAATSPATSTGSG